MRYALTVDPGIRDLRTADHLLRELVQQRPAEPRPQRAHALRRGDRPRVALSLALPSEPLPSTVRERLAARGHEVRDGLPDPAGRAVLYPGAAAVTATLTVAQLLTRSAIDRVTVLGAPGPPAPGTLLVTRDHVRPQWRDGELVLTTMPAAGGVLVPFEVPEPTPCCADH